MTTMKEYLGSNKTFMHSVKVVKAERKIYIKDPSHAPHGVAVQKGPHGGLYYDTDDIDPKDNKEWEDKEKKKYGKDVTPPGAKKKIYQYPKETPIERDRRLQDEKKGAKFVQITKDRIPKTAKKTKIDHGVGPITDKDRNENGKDAERYHWTKMELEAKKKAQESEMGKQHDKFVVYLDRKGNATAYFWNKEDEDKKESFSVRNYLENNKSFLHQVGNIKAERKIYIADPSHAPHGVAVQKGKRGGLYYDTDSIQHTDEAPPEQSNKEPKTDDVEFNLDDEVSVLGRPELGTGYITELLPDGTASVDFGNMGEEIISLKGLNNEEQPPSDEENQQTDLDYVADAMFGDEYNNLTPEQQQQVRDSDASVKSQPTPMDENNLEPVNNMDVQSAFDELQYKYGDLYAMDVKPLDNGAVAIKVQLAEDGSEGQAIINPDGTLQTMDGENLVDDKGREFNFATSIRNADKQFAPDKSDDVINQTMKKFGYHPSQFEEIKDLVESDYSDSDISQLTEQDVAEILDASGVEPKNISDEPPSYGRDQDFDYEDERPEPKTFEPINGMDIQTALSELQYDIDDDSLSIQSAEPSKDGGVILKVKTDDGSEGQAVINPDGSLQSMDGEILTDDDDMPMNFKTASDEPTKSNMDMDKVFGIMDDITNKGTENDKLSWDVEDFMNTYGVTEPEADELKRMIKDSSYDPTGPEGPGIKDEIDKIDNASSNVKTIDESEASSLKSNIKKIISDMGFNFKIGNHEITGDDDYLNIDFKGPNMDYMNPGEEDEAYKKPLELIANLNKKYPEYEFDTMYYDSGDWAINIGKK